MNAHITEAPEEKPKESNWTNNKHSVQEHFPEVKQDTDLHIEKTWHDLQNILPILMKLLDFEGKQGKKKKKKLRKRFEEPQAKGWINL